MLKRYNWLKHAFLALMFFLTIRFLFKIDDNPFSNRPNSLVMYDADDAVIGAGVANDGQWRFPPSDSFPERFSVAILTFEDQWFFYHFGINPIAILKAIYINFNAKKIVTGGSTITMQLARMLLNNPNRTVVQKLKEILLTLRLEMSFSKKELLQFYIEQAPFGGNIVGLNAASYKYYSLPPHLLSWSEMATLAVLPNAPSLVYPGKNQIYLLKKRNKLLEKLFKRGFLSDLELRLAKAEPLPNGSLAIKNYAKPLFERLNNIHKNGGSVKTTIQKSIQQKIENNLLSFAPYWQQQGYFNAAVLISDLNTGAVIAYHGNLPNTDPTQGASIDLVQRKRSYGSLLKPFLYAAMLQDGLILPGSLTADMPINYGSYRPRNFLRNYQGLVPANQVLVQSLNIPSVNWLYQYKTERFMQFLHKMGLNKFEFSAKHYGLSFILGGAELSPWQITGIYGALASKINGKNGFELQLSSNIKQTFNANNISETVAWFTTKAIAQPNRPDADGIWQKYNTDQEIAWKTGTSFGFRDAWAVGYTSQYLVTVWIGNASGEGRPNLTGLRVAVPFMFTIFDQLPKSDRYFEKPANGSISKLLCATTQMIAGENCPNTKMYDVPNVLHTNNLCRYHQLVWLDSNCTFLVDANCYRISKSCQKKLFILPPAIQYFYQKANPLFAASPKWLPSCIPTTHNPIDIIYPGPNAHIVIPKLPNKNIGQFIASATHSQKDITLYWYINQEFIGTTSENHQMSHYLSSGTYQLLLIDENGNEKQIKITISTTSN